MATFLYQRPIRLLLPAVKIFGWQNYMIEGTPVKDLRDARC